jgi:MFS family permease
MIRSKAGSVAILALAQVAAMSLWFVSAAILPELTAAADLSPGRGAALSSSVQIGFVLGAVLLAIHGTADRHDPRRLLALSALAGAAATLGLLVTVPGGDAQILLRLFTGMTLAGVYPPAMKIAVGWGTRDRGFLVGLLIGALTLGKAVPYLIASGGGPDWRLTIIASAALAGLGGLLVLLIALGPMHARAAAFDPGALRLAWTDRRIRLAYLGYLGHMWELYAFWAWIAAAVTVTFAPPMGDSAPDAARLLAFGAIALGGVLCLPAGYAADRIGKARVAQWALMVSGGAGLLTALTLGGPVWLTVLLVLVWGAAVIPDSGQFSALVADAAPPERAGSLLTLQTALGFTLTFFTVQATPAVAAAIGWQATIALMAIGPAIGVLAMRSLIALGPARIA